MSKLLPITLPIARSVFPLNAAIIEVTNSGTDEPVATIVKPITISFTPMSNTFKENKSKCMLKIVVHKLTDKVLGCHMFGETSSEIIQMVSISLNAGITKRDFDITMALHPTISEEFVTMYG